MKRGKYKKRKPRPKKLILFNHISTETKAEIMEFYFGAGVKKNRLMSFYGYSRHIIDRVCSLYKTKPGMIRYIAVVDSKI